MLLILEPPIICSLGEPRYRSTKHVPSMYHQCLKDIWKGKKVHVRASECSFQQDKAHFSEVTFFDELAKE